MTLGSAVFDRFSISLRKNGLAQEWTMTLLGNGPLVALPPLINNMVSSAGGHSFSTTLGVTFNGFGVNLGTKYCSVGGIFPNCVPEILQPPHHVAPFPDYVLVRVWAPYVAFGFAGIFLVAIITLFVFYLVRLRRMVTLPRSADTVSLADTVPLVKETHHQVVNQSEEGAENVPPAKAKRFLILFGVSSASFIGGEF